MCVEGREEEPLDPPDPKPSHSSNLLLTLKKNYINPGTDIAKFLFVLISRKKDMEMDNKVALKDESLRQFLP